MNGLITISYPPTPTPAAATAAESAQLAAILAATEAGAATLRELILQEKRIAMLLEILADMPVSAADADRGETA